MQIRLFVAIMAAARAIGAFMFQCGRIGALVSGGPAGMSEATVAIHPQSVGPMSL